MFQEVKVESPIFKYSFLFVGLAFIVGIFWWVSALSNAFDLSSGGSDYTIINSKISPNELYIADSYIMMGGGAAGWCYKLVKIKNQNESGMNDTEIFRTRCSSELEVKWENEKNLDITYSEELPFKPKTEWEGVRISYSLTSTNK